MTFADALPSHIGHLLADRVALESDHLTSALITVANTTAGDLNPDEVDGFLTDLLLGREAVDAGFADIIVVGLTLANCDLLVAVVEEDSVILDIRDLQGNPALTPCRYVMRDGRVSYGPTDATLSFSIDEIEAIEERSDDILRAYETVKDLPAEVSSLALRRLQ